MKNANLTIMKMVIVCSVFEAVGL